VGVSDYISVGSMVLVRVPGLSSKYDDARSDPYEVTRKVTPVTREIDMKRIVPFQTMAD